MDLLAVGSVGQYAKRMALQTQWKLKQRSGDITGHGKSLNDYLSNNLSGSRSTEERDQEKLSAITSKANAGVKLTRDEMEYLKEKNPILYEKLHAIEEEQKAYEEELKRCKSKDDVQRLHMFRVAESMAAAKNGDGTALYRMNRMSESKVAFTKSGQYKKLPTEAEQAAERAKESREKDSIAERAKESSEREQERVAESERDENAERVKAKPDSNQADAPDYAPDYITDADKTIRPRENVTDAETKRRVSPDLSKQSFGQRAYLRQMEAGTREESRRRKNFGVRA